MTAKLRPAPMGIYADPLLDVQVRAVPNTWTGRTTYEVHVNGNHIGYVSSWTPRCNVKGWWAHLTTEKGWPGYSPSRAAAIDALIGMHRERARSGKED